MSKANIISDLQVSLKENNGIANIPSDLFYGQVTLHKNSSTKSTVSNELQIIRKTSIFQLSTKGLIKYLGSNAGNFEYRIKNTKSSLDYNGNPTGEEVEFAFPASFDEKGNLTTEAQAIFPAQNITIELYKDGDLIFSSEKDKNGEYHDLTGNMSGCLLANYELSQRKAVNGSLPEDGALVKTIVTTNLADAIAKGYNVNLIEVLTGFKYIGQQILGFENSGKGTYLFGFEESYGCLIGTYARDKDAIVATMALCEAAAYYKTQGKTLWDAMIDMYEEFGYYKDAIQAVTMKGIEGLQKIQEIMTTLRQNPPAEFAGHKVTAVRDYKLDEITDLATGEKKPTGLPNSNVLYYELTDDAWVCVRPSGTEPKVKFYYGVKGTSLADADEKSDAMGKAVLEMVDSMK